MRSFPFHFLSGLVLSHGASFDKGQPNCTCILTSYSRGLRLEQPLIIPDFLCKNKFYKSWESV